MPFVSMAPTKVFIGNLSFKTREAELAQEFGVAGKVLTANIITRGPRSLGYGFVELDSEEEANKAVELLNKKEIDGRQINVEVARPRAERPEGEAPRRGSFRGRGSGRGRGRGSGRGGAERSERPERTGEPRRGRGGRAPQGERAPAAAAAEGGEADQAAEGAVRGRRRGGSRGRGSRGGAGRGRGGRGGARRADDGPREESDSTLFVANLPFSVTDEQLKAEFSTGGFNVKAAHVVSRVTGRSKGYGFVEYETKADQARALTEFEHKAMDGRELIVKIALKDNRPAADEPQQPQN